MSKPTLNSLIFVSSLWASSPAYSQEQMSAQVPQNSFSVCEERTISQQDIDTGFRYASSLTVGQAQQILDTQEKALNSLSRPKYPRAFFIFEQDPEYRLVYDYVKELIQDNRRWWGYECEEPMDEEEAAMDLIIPRVCAHLGIKAAMLEEMSGAGKANLVKPRVQLSFTGTKPPDPMHDPYHVQLYPNAALAAFFYREVCTSARFYNADPLDTALYTSPLFRVTPFVPSYFSSLSVQVTWDRLYEDEKQKIGFPPNLTGPFYDLARSALKKGTEMELQGKSSTGWRFVSDVFKKWFMNEQLEWLLSDGRVDQRTGGCPPSANEEGLAKKREEHERRKKRVLQMADDAMEVWREVAFDIPAVFRHCLCQNPQGKIAQQLEQRIKNLQEHADALRYDYRVTSRACATTKDFSGKFFREKYGFNPTEYRHEDSAFGGDSWCAQTRGYWERDHSSLPKSLKEWRDTHPFVEDSLTFPTLNYFSASCEAKRCWGDTHTTQLSNALEEINDIEKRIGKDRAGLFYAKRECFSLIPNKLENRETANALMSLVYTLSCQSSKAQALLRGLEKMSSSRNHEASALKGIVYYALGELDRARAVWEDLPKKDAAPEILPWLAALATMMGQEEQSAYYSLLTEQRLNQIVGRMSYGDFPIINHQKHRIAIASQMIPGDNLLPVIDSASLSFPGLFEEKGVLVHKGYGDFGFTYARLDIQALLLANKLLTEVPLVRR